jgi:hypothetical protein
MLGLQALTITLDQSTFLTDTLLIDRGSVCLCIYFSMKRTGREDCARRHGPGSVLFEGEERILNVSPLFSPQIKLKLDLLLDNDSETLKRV